MVDVSILTKLYYSIGEVAEMFDVSPSLVRYWESEFTYLKPQKNSKGDRRFTKQNIDQLNTIFHLVKEKGYTLEGAKREIKDKRKTLKRQQEVLQKLGKLKRNLGELKSRF
jgi:DNA-binding transcriptional MerR regulator